MIKCACGCGEEVTGFYYRNHRKIYCRFKTGHHNNGKLEKSRFWKGGRYIDSIGYVQIYRPNHPSSRNGYIAEHRLVMEQSIGRYLNKDEHIHHKDENRQNNDLDNLQLLTRSQHTTIHNTTDMSNRKCSICLSDKSWINRYGREQWSYLDGQLTCKRCKNREMFRIHYAKGGKEKKPIFAI